MEANDMKALREALEKIVSNIEMRASVFDVFSIIDRKTFLDAKSALAAPQRNCEVGTPEEQNNRFREFCEKYPFCKGCKMPGRKPLSGIGGMKCALTWAQMPYNDGGVK